MVGFNHAKRSKNNEIRDNTFFWQCVMSAGIPNITIDVYHTCLTHFDIFEAMPGDADFHGSKEERCFPIFVKLPVTIY